ncbi:phosphate ABC transporter permease subunit PstC [Selenomonas ruminis]|uniref:Phosphate transport system permease protein n=1 Tax=Selenomonas ruminis TaxID=2593411 RepID=A0A5D6WAQ5_9FIRM|nr:phosphate ABC transporter permease subunit PstC [Selenomonas sp. mPRGC5]TYZ24996.1 phosphate ABC transporter permease subunit PstC [Selenomonas sp. mPRGC5]
MKQAAAVSKVAAKEVDNGHRRRLFYDRCGRCFFIAAAALMTIVIFAIIFFVGKQGLQTFAVVSPLEFFFSGQWDPLAGKYGALFFILGSFWSTLLAILIGAPVGLMGAIFMAKVAPKGLQAVMRPAIDIYAAIPSVVYGYTGLVVLVPFLRETFGSATGFGVLAAALVLSLMVLPTIIAISMDAIQAVEPSMEEASLALGATWWQTVWHVVLPAAAPGILTAVVLAMARAIGETMAVQMLIGNTPQLITSLFTPTATLTSNIVVEMGNTPFGSVWGNALFLMAFVLLLLSLAMMLLVRRIGKRRVT